MKRTIFSALLAIVAIGGTLVTKAATYYGPNNTVFNCSGAGAVCRTSALIPTTVWTLPDQQGDPLQKSQIPASEKFN